MNRNDLVKVAAGVVVGVAVAAVVLGATGRNIWGNTDTDVTLTSVAGGCELGKATQVRVRKGKDLTWKIKNFCADGTDKIVSVGNFRLATASGAGAPGTSGTSTTDACADPGPDYPFTDASVRTATLKAPERDGDGNVDDPTKGKITLKLKGSDVLGKNEMVLSFDICLDRRSADPTLVIER